MIIIIIIADLMKFYFSFIINNASFITTYVLLVKYKGEYLLSVPNGYLIA